MMSHETEAPSIAGGLGGEVHKSFAFLDNDKDTVGKMMSSVVEAFEENPGQDFLGSLFMKLNLGSHWRGQFFTPFNVCLMMASMSLDLDSSVEKSFVNGYTTINDPSCGSGATLIAALHLFREHGINYQPFVLTTGYDIDRTAAEMCYIQLSLLGAAGYVVVTDTLTAPPTGNALIPDVSCCRDCFYTPMYSMNPVWLKRQDIVKKSIQFCMEAD